MEQSKKCTKCGTEKALSEFGKDKKAKDGYKYSCKSCNKAYQKAYNKAYLEANKDKIKEVKKAWYETNKDKIAENRKAYRQANKGKIKDKKKAHYEANKDKIKAKNKAYYEDNKDKIKDKIKAYHNKKRKEDAIYRLKCNLRTRLCQAVKNKGYSKNTKTADTLGCSWEFLKEYLEAQFTKGMNWDNYGEWHIDHIKPLASAKTEQEVYSLNHYTNLQPLWAEENLSKSDNIDYKQFKLLQIVD